MQIYKDKEEKEYKENNQDHQETAQSLSLHFQESNKHMRSSERSNPQQKEDKEKQKLKYQSQI